MLCEKCKTNQATVHVERNVNNIKTEYNLCFPCALAINMEMSFDEIIKEFLGSVIELENGKSPEGEEEKPNLTCPGCGMSYQEFREAGKLGCSQCYNAFRQQIDAILKNIHGSGEHLGKVPRSASQTVLNKRELGTLRTKLREAIENEEYEAAAELRDKIRGLEIHE